MLGALREHLDQTLDRLALPGADLVRGGPGAARRSPEASGRPEAPPTPPSPSAPLKTSVVCCSSAFLRQAVEYTLTTCPIFRRHLSMRQITRRGPVWRCADRVHIAYASSKALDLETGFPDPVSIDRLPLPFLRPARVPDSYPPGRLSGDGGSPVTLLLRHQRPDDARHPVGQRHGDQHARLARQHPGEPRIVRPAAPDRPADHRHGARDQ